MSSLKNSNAAAYKIPKLEKFLLNVKIEINAGYDPNFHNEKNDLLIILDKSGSMEGSPIDLAKDGILNIIDKCKRKLDKFYLMTFNTQVQVMKNFNKREVQDIYASGGTDFTPVIQQIRSLLKEFQNNLTIIFFTDGCGTYRQSDLDALQREIKNLKYNCVVQTIGFSEDHDATLLSNLTRIGSIVGSFQFVEAYYDIYDSIDNIIQYLMMPKKFVNLFLGNKKIDAIELYEIDGSSNVFDGDLLIKEFSEGKYVLEFDNEKHTITIAVSNEVPMDKLLKSINLEILNFIDLISTNQNIGRNSVEKIMASCENFKTIISEIKSSKLKQYSIENQRLLKQRINDVEMLINEFHMNFLTSAATRTLTNLKIATLNSFAYSVISNRTLKLKLDKRTQNNVELFDGIDNMVEKKKKNIDFSSLKKEDFNEMCILTGHDYVDALKDSDCLCLTIDIERPEAAIMDPTRVIIKSINSSFITADSFLEAVNFALNNTNDPIECHGGFNSNLNCKLFSGQSRENITGALPLYINDSHWSIAKQKMKPIMGFMATLNILGYSYEQITTIPFTVLARAIEDIGTGVTEFKKKVFKVVLDTCLQIYRESPSIREELIDKNGFIKFLKDPIERTIDCTPNLSLFLVKLLCAIKSGDLNLKHSQYELLNNYIIEEEHRRKQIFLFPIEKDYGFDNDKFLYEFLGVVAHEDIDPKVKIAKLKGFEIVKAAKTIIKNAGANELNEEQIQKLTKMSVEEINKLVILFEALKSNNEPRLDNQLANEALLNFDRITEEKMVHLRLILTSYKAKRMADLVDLDKTCIHGLRDYQKLAIMVQNLHGIKNSDRRFYLQKGLYIDPITDPAQLLKREYHRIVNDEIHKQCNYIRSKCVNFFSDTLRSTQEYFAFSNAVALAVGEFFLSIPNF